ncbi:isopentenyl phosphate kinase family protein [Candidatus Daviesbacteria bacterium]|nr:isopentenyl phosphate kinase family protein [Candidatus Daviesbacteria bacterium]
MKKLLIIKLGGSVITYKDSPTPKARLDTIKRLAKEIAQIYQQNKYQLILVHGAGSFGHPIAKKYNLHQGMKTKQQELAFSLMDQQMIELNSIIIQALLKNNLPAISLPPRSFVQQSAGKFAGFDSQIIKNCLDQNQIPVLFGDGVLDDKWGCSIISGDTIVSYLAQKLHTHQVIFLSDVDGIYTSDPKTDQTAKLIPEISNKNFNKVIKGLTPTKRHDVTGEMQGKIISLQRGLKDVPVAIVNGLKAKTLQQVLMQASTGTKLLLN